MAIQMYVTTEGLAKFRAAMETGSLVTLSSVRLYNENHMPVTTLFIKSNEAIDKRSNVYRAVCEDRSEDEYVVFGGELYDADGMLYATFSSETAVAAKQPKAEMLLGFEIKFDDNISVSDVIHIGDTTFSFDSATEDLEGVVELATEAEAKAGTDKKRAITPKILNAVIKGHTDVVHINGDEMILGKKSFSNDVKMHGAILPQSYILAKKSDDNSELWLLGGNEVGKGARVILYGSGSPVGNGSFRLIAVSADNSITLRGLPDGTLTWKDKNIVRSVNGTAADAAGNVVIPLKFLPLAGGTMTNTIKTTVNLALAKTDAKGGVQICGGTSLADGGAILGYGKDYESNAEFKGALRLQATDGTKTYDVVLFPDGRMRLGNNTQLNFQDNEDQRLFIDEHGDMVIGDTNGALLRVRGQKSEDNSGGFQFRAKDKDGNTVYLIGKPDGTLTWGGKEVLRSNSSSSWRIIELGGGYVMMWLYANKALNVANTYTFTLPIPMENAEYSVFTAINGIGGGYNERHDITRTSTNFTVESPSSDGWTGFIVVGKKA